MPNAPRNPYGGVPWKAAIGFGLMILAPLGWLLLATGAGEWRQALLTAILVLIGLGFLPWLKKASSVLSRLFRFSGRQPPARLRQNQPDRVIPSLPSFDQLAFLDAASRQNEDTAQNIQQSLLTAERVRKLTYLRDHPETSPEERAAADASIKKVTRPKKRTAKRKKP